MGFLHIRRVLVARDLKLRAEVLILSVDDEPIPSILRSHEVATSAHITSDRAMAEQWSHAFPSLCCQPCRELQACPEFFSRAGRAAQQEGLVSAIVHQLPNGRVWGQWIGPAAVCERYRLPGGLERDRAALRLLGANDKPEVSLHQRVRAASVAWAKRMSPQSSKQYKAKSKKLQPGVAFEDAAIAWFEATEKQVEEPLPDLFVDPPKRPELPAVIRDAFDQLQLEPTTSRAAIRDAFTRRMLQVHPDHGGNTQETISVIAAHRLIMEFLDATA